MLSQRFPQGRATCPSQCGTLHFPSCVTGSTPGDLAHLHPHLVQRTARHGGQKEWREPLRLGMKPHPSWGP